VRIAVIVVNYNSFEDTTKYVRKITKYESINRIIVVDNNSTRIGELENLKQVEDSKTTVIHSEKNKGYSYGNNFGVKYLENEGEKYDYTIISNSDIEIEENAIWECILFLERNDDTAVTAPRMHNKNNVPVRRSGWRLRTFWLDVIHSTRITELIFYFFLRKGEYSKKDYENKKLEVEAISGSFFIIKSNIFKEIKLFDENVFLFYEEDILGKKLKELDYKIYSINDVSFIHYESKTIGKMFSYYNKVKQLHKSKMYYQKQYNKIKLWQIAIFELLYMVRHVELLFEIPIRKFLNR